MYKKILNNPVKIIYIKHIDNQIYGIDSGFRTVYIFKNNTWVPFVNTNITNSDITTFTKINKKKVIISLFYFYSKKHFRTKCSRKIEAICYIYKITL